MKDTVRTRSYMNAIIRNSALFKDKIVLDVGCGTGILSLFASKAGAKHVYGIDCSDIADQAKIIVRDNGKEDTVTILKGKVEEITLPVDKVDIIISEWMGYFLFYESMLDTVIYARDKWLVPGGLILPDRGTLSLAAIEDAEYKHGKIDFWEDVYGFNMKCIRELALTEPLVDIVDEKQICSNEVAIFNLDINGVKKEDVNFKKPFKLTFERKEFVHALVASFDITFTFRGEGRDVYFSTSPRHKSTHWKQTVFYFDKVLDVMPGDELTGWISCKPSESNPRDLDIDLQYTFHAHHSGQVLECETQYKMR